MDIDVGLVRELVAGQFPHWADEPIAAVDTDGWDNRSFRLGSDKSVRLPSAAGYVPQIAKEHRWLPMLASVLPLPIPTPLGLGRPGAGYPFEWSIYGWIEGENASAGSIRDLDEFATDLADFLRALQRVPAAGGPPPGQHSAYRGGPLQFYDDETRRAISSLGDEYDSARVTAIWDEALASDFSGSPTWFHGDVAAGNLLVRNGRLAAVIDFGCSGVGDPACDLVIAWTLFGPESRARFRAALPLDDATWARGRGWALWKAAITIAARDSAQPERLRESRQVLGALLASID